MATKKVAVEFVRAEKVFADYSSKINFVARLAGKQPTHQSALRDVTFSIPHATHITLFGAEAAGKTTLLRLLTGVLKPTSGHISVNGHSPEQLPSSAAGYVSLEETEPAHETCRQILETFAATHHIANFSARLSEIADKVGIDALLYRSIDTLSTTEHLRLNIARAALADSPVILLDDAADILGATEIKRLLAQIWVGRTVIIATRFTHIAEQLGLPLLLLHKGTIVGRGTLEELATTFSCTRTIKVWVEGLRYDLLRRLRNHPGVMEVRLLPASDFSGQKLHIAVHSARYLPALYDVLSQTPLLRVEETPPLLGDVLRCL